MSKHEATARRWKDRAKRAEEKLWRSESEIHALKERIEQLEYQLSVGEEGALREEAAGYREMLTDEIDYGHRLRARIDALEVENRALKANALPTPFGVIHFGGFEFPLPDIVGRETEEGE